MRRAVRLSIPRRFPEPPPIRHATPFPSPLATLQHPAPLNAFQRYAQACSLLRNTSRASNPAWYADALNLDFQLHIRPDGTRICSFYYIRKTEKWSEGPPITAEVMADESKLESLIAEILGHARSNGAGALGVVLHIADEFATTELLPELDNPAALPDLRDTAVRHPESILQDTSIPANQASWRVIPYPAINSDVIGTTVVLSRQYEPLLAAMRQAGNKANFPIVTHALSAPLVAMMGLSHVIAPTPGKAFVTILQYPWFTVLAFFDENADLRLIRTLQHHGGSCPQFFRRNALATTNAALEFDDPDIFILRLCEGSDPVLENNLRGTFTSSRVEVAGFPAVEGLPDWCQEPAISAHPADAAHANDASHPITTRHPLLLFRDEQWSVQDFLPVPHEVVEMYPSRAEMGLLKISRLVRVLVASIAILFIAYCLLGMVDLLRSREWSFDPRQADTTKSRLAMLNRERQTTLHWNNLLDDRSKAWVAMESLARMFPENSGMLVKTYSHTSKPDTAPGQAKVGFVKQWKITGFVRDEALDYLNTLNTREGISAHFTEIARMTGNDAYNLGNGNRSVSINVRTQENGSFKPIPPEEIVPTDESTYPFTFDMTISQRFEATDPMAINVLKAP